MTVTRKDDQETITRGVGLTHKNVFLEQNNKDFYVTVENNIDVN